MGSVDREVDVKRAVIRDEGLVYDSVNQRLCEMRDHRAPLQAIYRDVWRYVVPERETYLQWYEHGYPTRSNHDDFAARIGQYIHDSTAASAIQLLSSGLQGHVVSEQDHWFKISFPHPEMDEERGARVFAQETEYILYDRLSKSNFYAELSPLIVDAAGTGTAIQYREYLDDIGGPVFNTLHPIEVFIDINDHRKVDTVYRMFNLTKRQAIMKFGKRNLSERIMRESVPSTQQFKFVHAVFPRTDLDPDMGLYPREGGTILAVDAPWISIYVELDEQVYGENSVSTLTRANDYRDTSNKTVVAVGGYQELPYSVWRWDVDPSTPYGISPTRRMMSLIRDLNYFGELLKEDAQLHVRPPLMVPSSLQGKARISPRGMNYTNDVNAKIEAILGPAGNYPVGADREMNLREQVREGFGVDLFVLMARLTAGGQSKTATEVLELQAEKSAVLASIKRNMGPELLANTLRWTFHQERRRGDMPDIPESLQRFSGTPFGTFRIEFIGPLAQAQKRLATVQGPLRIMEAAFQILDRYPAGWDLLDVDNILRHLFRDGGMPADDVREHETVAQLRRQKAERAAQEQMLEDTESMSRSARNFDTGEGNPEAAAAAGAMPEVA